VSFALLIDYADHWWGGGGGEVALRYISWYLSAISMVEDKLHGLGKSTYFIMGHSDLG